MGLQVLQIIVSIVQRKNNLDTTGDPWNARSLEWATSSPPPFYNFAVIPEVTTREAFWEMKKHPRPKPAYKDFHMPKNTASGLYIAGCLFFFGFAMVWHIIWLAAVSLIAAVVFLTIRAFEEEPEYLITAKEVEQMEKDPKRYSYLSSTVS